MAAKAGRAVPALLATVALAACQSTPVANTGRVAQETSEGRLHADIAERLGPQCQHRFCGDLVKVDCGVTIDIPLGYYDNRSGKLLAHCGGLGSDSASCPPSGWICPVTTSPYATQGMLRHQADAWDA